MNSNQIFSLSSWQEGNKTQIIQACKLRVEAIVSPSDLEQYNISQAVLIEHIVKLVYQNVKSGRIQRVIAGQMDKEQHKSEAPLLKEYLDRLIVTYKAEHSRIKKLADKDDKEWQHLFEQLTNRAYYMLLRLQISPVQAESTAVDFAQECCTTIFIKIFPCDVPFDAWSTKILNNLILQRYTRSRDLIDRKSTSIISVDQPAQDVSSEQFSLHELITDDFSISAFERIELQEWLLKAITHLPSPSQQDVIIYTYFYDLSDNDIAQQIDKTKNAVYILRHRALQQLQKILKE